MSADGDNIVIRHLQEFRAHVDARFDNIDLRFVKLEARVSDVEGVSRRTLGEVVELVGRVGQVEQGLAGLSSRVGQVEQGLDGLRKEVAEVQTGLGEVRGRLGEVERRFGGVEDVVGVVARRVERLETGLRVVERLDAVERKVSTLGRRGRR